MGIFSIFSKEKNKDDDDPYWEFDEASHFQPKLNKGDFFRLTGFDFGWFVLEPISKFIKDKEGELIRGKSLSYGQKALYYWWYVDAQVRNGGFVQFYYNGYSPYVSTIIKSLRHIGDKEMANLISKADAIYRKHEKTIVKAQEKDLFGSDLYDRLEDLSEFDSEYYNKNDNTMSQIEKYVRENPNEFCLDEEGKKFNMNFSGICKILYKNGLEKEVFALENGIITGVFKSYYESGAPKEVFYYSKGKQTGEREEFYENGNKKYTVRKIAELKQFEHYWYYENGNPKKLEHKQLEKDERVGTCKEWYDNGQLAESGTYISNYEREGPWLEFYKDGSKNEEAEFKNGDYLLHNYWDERGVQTLKGGTGLKVFDHTAWEDRVEHHENEYKNYQRHGKQYTYVNGIISLYQEMENGEAHGITRDYFKNGKIKEEKIYKNGKEISKKEFSMVENPHVATSIICETSSEWLINRELDTADTYPKPINSAKIATSFSAPVSLFEGYPEDDEIWYRYFVTVNENGDVAEYKFEAAINTRIASDVEKAIQQLKFEPATKDDGNVLSYSFVRFSFTLEEKK